MKWLWAHIVIVAVALAPRLARAQSVNPPVTSLLTLPADSVSSGGPNGALALLIVTIVTTAVLVAIAKISDLRRKREEQTVELEAGISAELLEHEGFFRSCVGPTVHIPFWRGSPAAISMDGAAPSLRLAQTAIHLATEAASRVRPDFTIENRIVVLPAAASHPADVKRDMEMANRFAGALKAS